MTFGLVKGAGGDGLGGDWFEEMDVVAGRFTTL